MCGYYLRIICIFFLFVVERSGCTEVLEEKGGFYTFNTFVEEVKL